MFRRKKPPTAQELANDIARDTGRRGWPAEAKAVTVRSPFGDAIRWSVIIPGRGVAVVSDDLRVVVASSNRPTPQAPSFSHTTVEADTEQTLRNLPLP
jgi:hypothetical protein|nr:MAG TPA: hypothetical protein [Caudoviricetes sp.]